MSGWFSTLTKAISPWAGPLNIAASVGLGLYGANVASNAAKANERASNNAMQLLTQQGDRYAPVIADANEARAYLKGMFLPGGMTAEEMTRDIESMPGYGFAKAGLEKAITNKQSGGGARETGRHFKEKMRWMNDYLYQPWFDKRMRGAAELAGYGTNAMGMMYNNAANQGRLLTDAANYSGDANMAKAGIWNNAIQSVAGDLMPSPFMEMYLGPNGQIMGRNRSNG